MIATPDLDVITEQVKRYAIAADALASTMEIHPVAYLAGLRLLVETVEETMAEFRVETVAN